MLKRKNNVIFCHDTFMHWGHIFFDFDVKKIISNDVEFDWHTKVKVKLCSAAVVSLFQPYKFHAANDVDWNWNLVNYIPKAEGGNGLHFVLLSH